MRRNGSRIAQRNGTGSRRSPPAAHALWLATALAAGTPALAQDSGTQGTGAQDTGAQDTGEPARRGALDFTLGIGVVPLSITFPDIQLEPIGGVATTLDGETDGLGVALSASREIGALGGVPLFGEVTAAIVDADSTVSSFRPLSGTGPFAFALGSSAGDTITLGTSTAGGATATATATVTDPAGGTASTSQTTTSPPGDNLTRNFAQSRTSGAGVAATNVASNGAPVSATAVGFVADTGGFTLNATGDLSALAVAATAVQEIDYAEVEARLVGAVPLGTSGWVATPSVAPAYRYLNRLVDARASVLLPVDPVANARAAVSLLTSDDLTAHYAGGSVGIGAVGQVPGGLIMSLGVDAGLLGLFADYDGASAIELAGIGTTTFGLGAVAEELDELAHFVRGSVGVTRQFGGFGMSFGGQVEYLSDVPTVLRGPGGTSAGGIGTARLGTDDALIVSGSFSVSLSF